MAHYCGIQVAQLYSHCVLIGGSRYDHYGVFSNNTL